MNDPQNDPAPWEQKPNPQPSQQQPQQGYPQQPPQQGQYQQRQPYPGASGGPMPQQQSPYGQMPPPMPGGYRAPQQSTAALVALIGFITAFVALGPIGAIVGIVAGFIALGDIKKTGKSGKGMALAGVIGGFVYMVLFVAVIGLFVFAVSSVTDDLEQATVAAQDGMLIDERIDIYYEANGDSLLAGGKQVKDGYPSGSKVTGHLKISDLVYATELSNPIQNYKLEIKGTYATIKYIRDDGTERIAATWYAPGEGPYDDNYQYDYE
ncbi:DUF4190 domain-containing protein [Planctomycetota bacterium]|nr:DUF4190 domain-containing protein [Planctomycetota bacterium]